MKRVKCLINGKELTCEFINIDKDCPGINVKYNGTILFVNYNEVLTKTKEILLGEFESKYNLIKEVKKTEKNMWSYQYAISFGAWVLNNKKKALCRYKKSAFISLISESINLANNH